MCTAVTYKTKDFYFGRTLDYEYSYGEKITIVPRNYNLKFKFLNEMKSHFAIIGMAHVYENYPLFYEAVNEKGLCAAGLNFVNNAAYSKKKEDKINIAYFEVITYFLSNFQTVEEVIKEIKNIRIVDTPFSEKLPIAYLHWIIADKDRSITLESTKEGLKVYDNPVGVLTNNPPFNLQLFSLNNYLNLSPKNPTHKAFGEYELNEYSRGMGAIGLPGDLSSQSRFIRASFVKLHSLSKEDEISSVSQFFHILNSVEQQRGCVEVRDNDYEITIYSSCCNASKGIYYYTCYDNHQINKVDMHKVDLNSDKLFTYPLLDKENINEQN